MFFLTVPWVGLHCVIVVFANHTHFLFFFFFGGGGAELLNTDCFLIAIHYGLLNIF